MPIIKILSLFTFLCIGNFCVAQKIVAKKTKTSTTKTPTKSISKPITKSITKTSSNNETVIKNYKNTTADSVMIQAIATELCICMAPIFDSINPLVLTLLEETVTIGEKKADVNFRKALATMQPAEQMQLMPSIAKLKQINVKDGDFEKCILTAELKTKKINLDYNPAKENAYDNLLNYYLKKQCKTVGLLLEYGKKTNN